MSSFLQSLKQYIRFSEADSEYLAELLEPARPYFQGFAENFYDRIAQHPDAHRVLEGPAQVARLKMTLMKWMRTGLRGPHDEPFYELRSRIGRMHVVIGLPQQYMVTAMNVMRLDFFGMLEELYRDDPERAKKTRNAVSKLFDMELAIMLRTYQEDSEERLRRNVRVATRCQVSAQISHELCEPLRVIRQSADSLKQHVSDDEDGSAHVQRLASQAEVCEEIIIGLARAHEDEPLFRRRIDMLPFLTGVLASVESSGSQRLEGLVEISCEPGLTMQGDPDLLQQAVRELVMFALDACGGRSSAIHVLASTHERASMAIDVTSLDVGFDVEAVRARLESPAGADMFRFETAIIQDIAVRHGGVVQVLEQPASAVLRLLLPKTP